MDIEICIRLTFDSQLDHDAVQELEDRLHEILNKVARENGRLAPEGYSIYDYDITRIGSPEED